MNTIEIQTTHNVTIEYKLANVLERFVAWLLDLIFLIAANILLFVLFVGLLKMNEEYAGYFINIPLFFFYHLVMESLNNGQSLGKMIMKIKVIKLNGDNANLFDYLMRWTFRLVDISMSFGTVALLSMSSSNRNQRIGDFLSDMVVIKISTQDRIGLDNVMKISELKKYKPVYPAIRSFTDDDMLLIKETIDRYNHYKTPGHKKALDEILIKIKTRLDIPIPEEKLDFLNTLIKDYVALTR